MPNPERIPDRPNPIDPSGSRPLRGGKSGQWGSTRAESLLEEAVQAEAQGDNERAAVLFRRAIVAESGEPVDFISKAYKAANVLAIEEDVDQLFLAIRDGRLDPFFMPLADLPYQDRDQIKGQIMESIGFKRVFEQYGPPTTMREADATERGFARYMFPREMFLEGRATPELLGYAAQNFQIDPALPGHEAYFPTGRQVRQSVLSRTTEQLNNRLRFEGKRLVFDVESAGLDVKTGIWQLSARLMEGDTELESLNLHFRNNFMDIGEYAHEGRPMRFEEFYEAMRGGGKIEWIGAAADEAPQTAFARGMTPFLELAEKADWLVAQNAIFDIEMLRYGIEHTDAWKNDPEFQRLAQSFFTKADSDKTVDLLRISSALMGEIQIAPELARLTQFTPFAMENILLSSSVLADIEHRLGPDYAEPGWGNTPREIIEKRLEAGLHHGDVDTWFENQLLALQQDVVNGADNYLQVGEGANLPTGRTRDLITKGVSITPFTKGEDGLTPIERAVLRQRNVDATRHIPTPGVRTQMFQTGIFDRWMSGFMTKEGTVAKQGIFGAGFDEVQQQAIRLGLPFAGLSGFERVVSSLMGVTTLSGGRISPQLSRFQKVRQVAGEMAGTSMFRTAAQANVWGGHNVALPMGLIQEAEKAEALTTRFRGAVGVDEATELQEVRYSPFKYKREGREFRDVAMVVDAFEDDAQVAKFTEFLSGLTDEQKAIYGLTPKMMGDVQTALKLYGRKYGIQLGTMGGGAANSTVNRLYEFLDQTGLTVDKSAAITLRSYAFGPTQAMQDVFGQSDVIFGTPTFIDSTSGGAVGEFRAHSDSILTDLNRLIKMNEYYATEVDNNLLLALHGARRTGAGTRAEKFYNFFETGLRQLPARAGIAAAAASGYYMYRRWRKQEEYDETFEQQEYESPARYQYYRQQMGEPMPQRPRPSRVEAGLSTAGTVQQLDRDKTRHHQMGAGKYEHLYRG